MAPNKFATMLHRNTSKFTMIIVYTVLEWILIVLLLLNSVFSYLIMKFAVFFGLETPCIWCSRIEHVFETRVDKHCYRDLLCKNHAMEISRLGYCSNHGRLAEASDMCEDCSFSQPRPENRIAFGISIDGRLKKENGDQDMKCSCCAMSLNGGFYSKIVWNHGLFKNSWGVAENTHKEKESSDDCESPDSSSKLEWPIEQIRVGEKFFDPSDSEEEIRNREDRIGERVCSGSQCKESGVGMVLGEPEDLSCEGNQNFEGNTVLEPFENIAILSEECKGDAACEILPIRSANCVDNNRLLSLELIDLLTAKNNIRFHREPDARELSDVADVQLSENDSNGNQGEGILDPNSKSPKQTESVVELETVLEDTTRIDDGAKSEKIETWGLMVLEDEGCSVLPAEEAFGNEIGETQDQNSLPRVRIAISQATSTMSRDGESVESEIMDGFVEFQVTENTKVSISEVQESRTMFETGSIEKIEENMNNHLLVSTENNEGDEKKFPQTPTNMEGIHNLHSRLFDRKEMGTESLDGRSAISELEGGDGSSIELLKESLKAERKALSALYAELEEERSASAVAANQTMAMITRLQEEKSAMQMEALQYQRMMEEQSEYDQEALQLMNELIVKREKEKQELEKEVELYRRKFLLYEAKEKRLKKRKANDQEVGRITKNRVSSTSSSPEDSDDLNEGDDNFYNVQESSNHSHATNGVLSLGKRQESVKALGTVDESFADFEEERISILEQLKVLEEKLFTLGDEEPFENVSEENGKEIDRNGGFCDHEGIEISNGFSSNERHQTDKRNLGSKPKRLLPFFDAESEEAELDQEEPGTFLNHAPKFQLVNDRVSIEEEVDHVYERLQALEADREFLKHCISSLKKGDKGIDLLQEILQHLRDLRSVELRVRNVGDALT